MRATSHDGYWQAVSSKALNPPTARLPSMSWQIPFELALGCSRSILVPVALGRAARGELPAPSALLTSSDRTLLARIDFESGPMFLPLSVQLLERRR
jgi:hypothetical protein